MPPIVTSLATQPPHDLPIWARLALIAICVPFSSVTHWQAEGPNVIVAHRRTGMVLLRRNTH
ncbi:hypothetical protein ACPC54_23850 [Kitasatospora sp. NPDC094028]